MNRYRTRPTLLDRAYRVATDYWAHIFAVMFIAGWLAKLMGGV
jgi:hypothetical protein